MSTNNYLDILEVVQLGPFFLMPQINLKMFFILLSSVSWLRQWGEIQLNPSGYQFSWVPYHVEFTDKAKRL